MKYSREYIERLLGKFVDGLTTELEEQRLAEYFDTADDIPAEWQVYKEMFCSFKTDDYNFSNAELDAMLTSDIAVEPFAAQIMPKNTSHVWRWMSVAACAAVVVCRNVSLNMLRDARCNVQIDKVGYVTNADNPHNQLEIKESDRMLKQSIRALSDRHRAIIRMRNVENMPYADIARILGTTESSVRGMISKARTELIKNLKKAKQ